MNLKEICFGAAIVIVGLFAGFLIHGNSGTGHFEHSIEIEAGSTQQKPVASRAAIPGESRPTVDGSNSKGRAEQQVEDGSPDNGPRAQGLDLERTFIRGNTLAPSLENDETFDRLIAQLRQDTSSIAAEKRTEYELRIYSQPLARSGAVSVDRFECGDRLCAVELRAFDPANLGEFVKTLVNSEDFESRAVVVVMAEPTMVTPEGKVTRIVFSHDPTINSVSVPRLALGSEG